MYMNILLNSVLFLSNDSVVYCWQSIMDSDDFRFVLQTDQKCNVKPSIYVKIHVFFDWLFGDHILKLLFALY
jgi:hypothetical protein